MTAKVAFGHEVIADEPTDSGMRAGDGRSVMWEQTRTLLLDDGSTAYGCQHCDYVSRSPKSIRPHLKAHTGKPEVAIGSVAELAADRNAWRTRALKAERLLRKLRAALDELI